MNFLPLALRRRAWDRHTEIETQRHVLLYLFLELTRRCNLSCRHCGSDCSVDSECGELDTASWLKIVDYFARTASPKPAIVLTGGEPLLHPGFVEIASALQEAGLSWGMVTNGFCLDEERLARIVDSGIESVTVSYDGTEEAHTWLRRHPLAHERAIRAMRLIGESSIPTRDAVTCVIPSNFEHLDETAQRLAGLGMNSWRLFRVFPKGRAAGVPELALSRELSLGLVDWIAEARKRWAPKGLDIAFSCEGYLPFALDRKIRTEPFFCRSGINIASILCDGTVSGCNNNGPEYAQGSLVERDFFDIWENEFRECRARDWMRTGICADCADWGHCRGGSIHLRDKVAPGPGFCYIKDSPSG